MFRRPSKYNYVENVLNFPFLAIIIILSLIFSRVPVRVCDACHEKIQEARTPMSSKMVNTLDMESVTVGQAIGEGVYVSLYTSLSRSALVSPTMWFIEGLSSLL